MFIPSSVSSSRYPLSVRKGKNSHSSRSVLKVFKKNLYSRGKNWQYHFKKITDHLWFWFPLHNQKQKLSFTCMLHTNLLLKWQIVLLIVLVTVTDSCRPGLASPSLREHLGCSMGTVFIVSYFCVCHSTATLLHPEGRVCDTPSLNCLSPCS